ncbi:MULTISPECIES: hypothetical protein [unclassified Shewanella]|uniref:hypothetical protein n=1 Tax=unclassified Shewanella TaxID=196818 RepID=UPI0021D81F79|nr:MULTISPECIES: hypothetical protein [unclassified Shewanella]MCU7986310.1 hypothetical protein [Shewanella sp. SW24]MCU8069610.1 hypothetical protein [Shewanella sp. SM32]MCU8086938.1 hypothetical protein [Shewanella sp. SM21]
MLVCVAIMLIAHSASYAPKPSVQRSDAARHYAQMHTVSLDSSTPHAKRSAEPQSLPDADVIAQSNAQSDAQTVESCGSPNSHDTDLVSSDSELESQPAPCPSSDYVSHSDDLDFAPINSPRFISLAQHDVREVKPVYVLAVDFTAEPTSNVVEPTDLDITSDWTLSAVSSPARISGWKVSNLQYRFSQQAA